MAKYENVYEDWKSSPDVDKFDNLEEYTDGKAYLDVFYQQIESVLALVPKGLAMSNCPELDVWEVRFHWYSGGRMLEILIESGEKKIIASREPDSLGGEFYFGDPFDGLYESKIEILNTERIKKLFTWLIDE